MSLLENDRWYEMAIEQAAEELYDELGREPTDEEVEKRAQYIIDSAEPDWDAYAKDEKLLREDNCE